VSENPNVLIVDDDSGIRDLLADYLTKQGMQVSTARDGKEMDERLAELGPNASPDLIVMDLMLPGEDGLSLTRRVKATRDVPVIMLSARGEDIDRIVGLEVGADDYLAKPFNPRELLARIRAVLRRGHSSNHTANHTGNLDQAVNETARFGPFTLDLAAQVLSRDGAEIPLSQAEFTLLKLFIERPNRALSRDQIMDNLKGYERDPFDRSIDVRVTRLRKKLEDDPTSPVYIRTVWGQGYLFSPKGKSV
jgi:DNA-binding response OmpR family regulator